MMTALKSFSFIFMLSVLLCSGACKAEQKYEPTDESLARHDPAPEWLQDAKLGIYFHWGVYSVPAFGNEWYPHHMHKTGERVNTHHIETWGDPTEFEYADFVPMFKAEYFDADAWALLFKKAGAKFAGPVAEHHDGFSMWDSDVTPWNAMDMGPKRDITGELAEALRKQNMRLITTFHHARNNLWKKDKGQWTGHYMYLKKNYPSLLEDDKRAILYGAMPRDQFVSMWKDKLIEVIDQYHPDIIWFDSWLDEIPQKDRFEFAAYYLNEARKRNQDVVIVRKQEDLPLNFSILDHEKSRMSGASERVWMTDDTVSTGSWCYTQDLKIKPAEQVIHALIDTVSKNGVVLLNISPKADGTIPADQEQVLLELGKWLEINGEGIYETRPWKVYGEGPTQEPEGGFGDAHKFLKLKYSAEDIRYTRSKDGKTLYAIALGRPGKNLTLGSVSVQDADSVKVSLLGSDVTVPFTVNADRTLTLNCSQLENGQWPSDAAVVFKLAGFDYDVNPDYARDAQILEAEDAVLNGQEIRLEKKGNRTNIGWWNRSNEDIHWLLKISDGGDYRFRGEFASLEDSQLVMQVNGKQVVFRVAATGDWDKPSVIEIGTIHFDKPGVYHLQLSPEQGDEYRAVNLWTIQCFR